jgi:hypothetical protein
MKKEKQIMTILILMILICVMRPKREGFASFFKDVVNTVGDGASDFVYGRDSEPEITEEELLAKLKEKEAEEARQRLAENPLVSARAKRAAEQKDDVNYTAKYYGLKTEYDSLMKTYIEYMKRNPEEMPKHSRMRKAETFTNYSLI